MTEKTANARLNESLRAQAEGNPVADVMDDRAAEDGVVISDDIDHVKGGNRRAPPFRLGVAHLACADQRSRSAVRRDGVVLPSQRDGVRVIRQPFLDTQIPRVRGGARGIAVDHLLGGFRCVLRQEEVRIDEHQPQHSKPGVAQMPGL